MTTTELHSTERGTRLGSQYGRLWGGDPWALAQAIGAEVRLVTAGEMRASAPGRVAAPGREVAARLFPQGARNGTKPAILLLASLSPGEQTFGLAHELAHVFHSICPEMWCDSWATAFLAQRQR